MKYNLHVNQKRALELGIKNINQAHVFDLLSCSQLWAKPEIINGEVYYWVARQRICDELEILSLKPDTVYRHLKSLNELKLIGYQKKGKKDLIQITKLGKSYYVGNRSELSKNSEINPTKFGKRSEFYSEINPTYKDTNIINNTNYNNKKTNKKESSENQIEEPLEMVSSVSSKPVVTEEDEKEFESTWAYYREQCKKQDRLPGDKGEAQSRFRKQIKKFGLAQLKQSIYNYSQDCVLRTTSLKHLSSFLALNKTYVESWLNGSENHEALLELKKKPNNHQNNSRGFKNEDKYDPSIGRPKIKEIEVDFNKKKRISKMPDEMKRKLGIK